ncbi:MAG: cupin domain-containing protein [Pseudomonadales bacterium]|nr:cupin domain-containing protein [Candidatus Woesebacteria bacterium]MCB9800906.1 cupin domain-containing protein [Pseudomonadales bacterium]
MTGYIDNIEQLTQSNSNFRHVLFTAQHLQLVLMSLKPKEDIGMEVHATTDQFFRVEAGTGKVIMNGEEREVGDGDVVIVPAGTKHNIINSSSENELKLYTIYAPPHHVDGVIHVTKAEAEADTTDHL